jgi:hypothetical protein
MGADSSKESAIAKRAGKLAKDLTGWQEYVSSLMLVPGCIVHTAVRIITNSDVVVSSLQ